VRKKKKRKKKKGRVFIKCFGCRKKMPAIPRTDGRGHLCSYCPKCIEIMNAMRDRILEASRVKRVGVNHARKDPFDKPRLRIHFEGNGRFGQRFR